MADTLPSPLSSSYDTPAPQPSAPAAPVEAERYEPAPYREPPAPRQEPVHVEPVASQAPVETRTERPPVRAETPAPVSAPAPVRSGTAPFVPLSFDSELQQVETSAERRAAAAVVEAPRVPRPPRQRPVRPPVVQEPLQQVETRNK